MKPCIMTLTVYSNSLVVDIIKVHHESVEDVMLGRMFLLQEMSKLKEEKKRIQTDPGAINSWTIFL